MAAPTITSVSPEIFKLDGGYEIVLTGTFELDTPYRVHIGESGDATDSVCHAGPGLGNDITSIDGTTLTVYTPELPVGDVYSVFAMERDTPGTNGNLVDVVIVIDRDYSTSLWQMKGLFAPTRRMGARNMAALPAPDQPENHMLYSEDFTNGVWSVTAVAKTDAQPDPYGTSRGVMLHEDGAAGTPHLMDQVAPAIVVGRIYTASVYAKAINRNYFSFYFGVARAIFDLDAGEETDSADTISTSIQSVDHLGDTGWFRLSLTWKEPGGGFMFLNVGPAEGPLLASTTFNGLNQDSTRVAFPALDYWSVRRAYRMTEGTVVT